MAIYDAVELILSDGSVQLVSQIDYEAIIKAGPWFPNNRGYAHRQIYTNGKQAVQLLHKFIADLMGLSPDLQVDHKDRKRFNCTRFNLRNATNGQNQCNSDIQSNNTSGYKGVSWHKIKNKWAAYVQINNKKTHLGYFDTAEEAAKVYDLAALRYYGEFAVLNFSIEDYADQIAEINRLRKIDDYRNSLKKIDRNGNLV